MFLTTLNQLTSGIGEERRSRGRGFRVRTVGAGGYNVGVGEGDRDIAREAYRETEKHTEAHRLKRRTTASLTQSSDSKLSLIAGPGLFGSTREVGKQGYRGDKVAA